MMTYWAVEDDSPSGSPAILPPFSTFDPASYNILPGVHTISLISPLPHAHQNIIPFLCNPTIPVLHWALHQLGTSDQVGPLTIILIETKCSHAMLANGLGSSSRCLPENCLPPQYNQHIGLTWQMPNDRLYCALHHFSCFCNLVDDTAQINIIWHLQLQSYWSTTLNACDRIQCLSTFDWVKVLFSQV